MSELVGGFDLALRVPTPAGMCAVGDLRAGAQVFGSDGTTVLVAEVTDLPEPVPCHRIDLCTGEQIVVAEDQSFLVERREAPRSSAIVVRCSAAEVAAEVAARGHRALATRVAPAVRMRQAALPIDPYLLGVWLAAGPAHLPAVHGADEELVRSLVRAGVRVFTSPVPRLHWVAVPGLTKRRGDDLTSRLRTLGVHRAKHVPKPYLCASLLQRRDLLAGLLDAAAVVDDRGEIVFRQESLRVAVGAYELIASLGFRPRYQRVGELVEVRFFAPGEVFARRSLQRQVVARRRLGAARRPRRVVVAAQPVGIRPVRQVRVKTDDGVLLVGRAFVPVPGAAFARSDVVVPSRG